MSIRNFSVHVVRTIGLLCILTQGAHPTFSSVKPRSIRRRGQLLKTSDRSKRRISNAKKDASKQKSKLTTRVLATTVLLALMGGYLVYQKQQDGSTASDEALDTYEKKFQKTTFGARLAPSIWKVKSKPKADATQYYSEEGMKDFLKKRVPDLVDEWTSPENPNSRRKFGKFITDLYFGKNISHHLPGIDSKQSQQDTSVLLRMVINIIRQAPSVFYLNKAKIDANDEKEKKQWEAIQAREIRKLYQSSLGCNLDFRKAVYDTLSKYQSAKGGLDAQIEHLIEEKKEAVLSGMILQHDADVIQLGKETEAWNKNQASARNQLPHKRAMYIHSWGRKLGISPEIVRGDRFLSTNRILLMPNHHWVTDQGIRIQKSNRPALQDMDQQKFIAEYRRRLTLEILDVAQSVKDSIETSEKSSEKNTKNDEDDVTKINFESFRQYYYTLNMSKEDPKDDKKKTYDILIYNGDISSKVDSATGKEKYHVSIHFILFVLEDLGIIEGFTKGYMAHIRKKNPTFTVSRGTKVSKEPEDDLDKKNKVPKYKTKVIHDLVKKPYSEIESNLEQKKWLLYQEKDDA